MRQNKVVYCLKTSLTLNTKYGCWLAQLRVKKKAMQKFMIKRIAVTRVVIWLKLIMNISYVIFYVLFSLGRVSIGCNSSLFMMYLDFWMYSGFPLRLCNIHNILCYSYKLYFVVVLEIFYCGSAVSYFLKMLNGIKVLHSF